MNTKLFVPAFLLLMLAVLLSACGGIPTPTPLKSVPFSIPGKITLVQASGVEVIISFTGMHMENTFGIIPEDYFEYSVQPKGVLTQEVKETPGYCGNGTDHMQFGGKCNLILMSKDGRKVVLRLNANNTTELLYDPKDWSLK